VYAHARTRVCVCDFFGNVMNCFYLLFSGTVPFFCFVFLTNFLPASKFGNDVYAVSEDMFEDLCVICWNLWQFYVGKVNVHSYDVIKHYVYRH